ncbi:unnamed protein product [Cyclocybe aegerita]|uniref:Uncharacterized protein n=1 Tax=Cyclocybe aegerita TaxID=1973307 RepID=A0A8S0X510_CYCAE|nr:unnamed protein product [Cyclocybe aegerita]
MSHHPPGDPIYQDLFPYTRGAVLNSGDFTSVSGGHVYEHPGSWTAPPPHRTPTNERDEPVGRFFYKAEALTINRGSYTAVSGGDVHRIRAPDREVQAQKAAQSAQAHYHYVPPPVHGWVNGYGPPQAEGSAFPASYSYPPVQPSFGPQTNVTPSAHPYLPLGPSAFYPPPVPYGQNHYDPRDVTRIWNELGIRPKKNTKRQGSDSESDGEIVSARLASVSMKAHELKHYCPKSPHKSDGAYLPSPPGSVISMKKKKHVRSETEQGPRY